MSNSEPVMVMVPADLLTRAVQLLGELPSKHSAAIFVELKKCKTLGDTLEDEVKPERED